MDTKAAKELQIFVWKNKEVSQASCFLGKSPPCEVRVSPCTPAINRKVHNVMGCALYIGQTAKPLSRRPLIYIKTKKGISFL